MIYYTGVSAGVAQLVEQLICNQQVGGSSPSTSSISIIKSNKEEFPSGQREQTVNLPSTTSVVRIHPLPPKRTNRQPLVRSFSMYKWIRNELQEARKMCADWEKAPVELSIAEKRIHLCPPRKPPNQAVFRLFMGFLKVAETAKNRH